MMIIVGVDVIVVVDVVVGVVVVVVDVVVGRRRFIGQTFWQRGSRGRKKFGPASTSVSVSVFRTNGRKKIGEG